MISRNKVKKEFLGLNRAFVSIVRHPIISVFIFYYFCVFSSWELAKLFEDQIKNPEILQFWRWHYYHYVTVSTIGYGEYTLKSVLGQNILVPYISIVGGTIALGVAKAVWDWIQKGKKFYERSIMSLWDNHRIVFTISRSRSRSYAKYYITKNDEVKDVIVCCPKEVEFLPDGAIWKELALDDIEQSIVSINISKAVSVTIDVDDDWLASQICLLINQYNPSIEITVSLRKESAEKPTSLIASNIVCIPPNHLHIIANETVNRGFYQHRRDSSSDGGEVDSGKIQVPSKFVDIPKLYLAQYLLNLNVNIYFIIRGTERISHPKNDFMVKGGDWLGVETEPGFDPRQIDWNAISI